MNSILSPYKVCFLGRTGNGKSSLINSLFAANLATDPLLPCTKILSATTVLSDEVEGFDAITAYDTPGIGEFSSIAFYQRYYEYAVSESDCIVLVTTLDRTDAPAQRLLMQLNKYAFGDNSKKFIVALNHIDSRVVVSDKAELVWDVENNEPTSIRKEQIEQRIQIIHEKFDGKFLPFEVVPVCAKRNFGIKELKKLIINK